MSSGSAEITREQQHVTAVYDRLDGLRADVEARLKAVLTAGGGTHQARAQRDGETIALTRRGAQLDAVESGLCFGRLDRADGDRLYVGRIGIRAEDEDLLPMLIDWRAPAARPFYVATAAAPEGVRRRRHIRTRGRSVVGLDDDVLDDGILDGAAARALEAGDLASPVVGSGPDSGLDSGHAADGDPDSGALVGEGALLAAVNRGRTGRMRDVVETIQAEQDHAIRAPFAGVQVVQGGPGTGKTAVALHRAAYLLYTHRQQLERRGVLVVGPNTAFLRYISQVLPALGESSAVLATVGRLFPGVVADAVESPEAAEIKGRALMAEVVEAAVRDREHVPDEPVELVVDRERYVLLPVVVEAARDAARRAHRQHNLGRARFVELVLEALARQAVERLNDDPFAELTAGLEASIAKELGLEVDELGDGETDFLGEDSVELAMRDLRADDGVRAVLDWLWPDLTPQQLLTDLFGSRERLESAAPRLTAAERELLLRLPHPDPFTPGARPGEQWTPADVPLLDEAAELLGVVTTAQDRAEEKRRAEALEYAQGVMDILLGSRGHEFEERNEAEGTATDVLNASIIAERAEDVDLRTVAERAAADRTWAYGHVVVDEAQELSAMAWRLLMRRCPTKSMTVVGDVAQTGDPAGTLSWGRVLAPHVEDRWRLAELTVNYRTPSEIMARAAGVLGRIDPEMAPPRSVRDSGVQPWDEWITGGELDLRLPDLVAAQDRELAALAASSGLLGDTGDGEGRLAVIVPAARLEVAARALAATREGVSYGEEVDLESRVVVITARQAKGLEFDGVIVVDPEGIATEGPRGDNDLYVAFTRATQRLGVLHVA